jgi:hypothetical protein
VTNGLATFVLQKYNIELEESSEKELHALSISGRIVTAVDTITSFAA